MRDNVKRFLFVPVVGIAAVLLSASSCEGANDVDERATDKQLAQYQISQPIPFYEWSQYRETLLGISDAQARGTATTSFFFNQGVNKPIKICPSIGYPVATTGVYTGESSGTYVVCVIDGKAVPTYWEGFVHTEGGPAKWDNDQQLIVNSGAPSVTVSTE